MPAAVNRGIYHSGQKLEPAAESVIATLRKFVFVVVLVWYSTSKTPKAITNATMNHMESSILWLRINVGGMLNICKSNGIPNFVWLKST